MNRTARHSFKRSLVFVAAVTLLAGCADEAPLAPDHVPEITALATLRRVTARYHDLNAALVDGFVLLHPCEERPGEGPVGLVYYHPGRLMDGLIDPETPDALVYEPSKKEQPKLVGVEFAVPYSLWTKPEPPSFLGTTFQPEDEFGVWGLHIWVWRDNPEGMFAESNPRVSCEAE